MHLLLAERTCGDEADIGLVAWVMLSVSLYIYRDICIYIYLPALSAMCCGLEWLAPLPGGLPKASALMLATRPAVSSTVAQSLSPS